RSRPHGPGRVRQRVRLAGGAGGRTGAGAGRRLRDGGTRGRYAGNRDTEGRNDVIDENLSHLSDLAFEGAMAGYLVALVCHAIEAASRRVRQPVKDAVLA